MTPFVSLPIVRINGDTTFRRPRKERPDDATQARKAAARFWNRTHPVGYDLLKVIVLRERGGIIEIAERRTGEIAWTEYTASVQEAVRQPELAAALAEIGIDAEFAPPEVPDVLVINGQTYRRDI